MPYLWKPAGPLTLGEFGGVPSSLCFGSDCGGELDRFTGSGTVSSRSTDILRSSELPTFTSWQNDQNMSMKI